MTQSYPLQWPEGWPKTPKDKRKRYSQFRTAFVRARDELQRELARLGAKHVVVSSWLAVRNDGQPYADAARRRIDDPGVAVYFELRGRPMVMARDAFETVHDNLRSIGLAIEHLRGLERHGGGTMMERAFDGFLAIAAPKDAWTILGVDRNATPEQIVAAHRMLAKQAHPDAGGSDGAMAELNRARDVALAAAKEMPQ
jgi:hypothetical protein